MYYFARFTVRLILLLLFRVRVKGIEHIPAKGSVIVCSNHISNWDPTVIGCFLTRPVSFMGKEELFAFRPLGALLRSLHTFPIKRGTGDRGALRVALEILKKGEVLVMFPEGTRKAGGTMQTVERGIGFLAARSEAAVLPVIIQGSYRIFRPLTLHIGNPFVLKAHDNGQRYTVEEATDRIGQQMRTLLKETQFHD